MKKHFIFVYRNDQDDPPDALHLHANNVTNAREGWEVLKDHDDTLLAIFEGGQRIWASEESRGMRLERVG